jgi:TonB family protein
MNTIRIFVFGTIALASAGQLVAADTPEALPPSGPWRLNQSPTECHIERTFGIGEREVTLGISRRSGTDLVDMAIAGTSVPRLRQQAPVAIAIQPLGTGFATTGYSMTKPDRPERIVAWFDAELARFRNPGASQTVTVNAADRPIARLALGKMDKVWLAFDECYAGLLQFWNAGPAIGSQQKQPPKRAGSAQETNPGIVVAILRRAKVTRWSKTAWVTPMDYPSEALRQEKTGSVVMALALNAEGRVNNCRVIAGSGFEPLDRQSCDLLTRRARYEPARDENGVAIPATAIERIIWQIPAI